jgi:uncharacterized protein
MSVIRTIKHAIRLAAVAAALVVAAPAAQSEQPSAAATATAKQLVITTGAMALFNPLISGVVEQAKLLLLQQDPGLAKDLNEIAGQMRTDLAPRSVELTNEVATLYASSFTNDELKAILVFYQSPVGKKLLERQPQVIESSMQFAQKWANKLSDEVVAKMRVELKKRGHNL